MDIIRTPIENLHHFLPENNYIYTIDSNVLELYPYLVDSVNYIKVECCEENKTLEQVYEIYEKFHELEVNRDTFIVGIGGGILCDICGFVCSTYLRGLSFSFVPTTLLAQVDASIGGKNGVNFKGYKNQIGTINLPKFSLIDLKFLDTLDDIEFLNGLAEILKYSFIYDHPPLRYIEENKYKILNKDPKVLKKIITDSKETKQAFVNSDFLESNERKKLNFGHTFGHAIEKRIPQHHGFAVAYGMKLASALSNEMGYLESGKTNRIYEIIDFFGFPNFDYSIDINDFKKDKKSHGNYIDFILLEDIGKSKIVSINYENLKDL